MLDKKDTAAQNEMVMVRLDVSAVGRPRVEMTRADAKALEAQIVAANGRPLREYEWGTGIHLKDILKAITWDLNAVEIT